MTPERWKRLEALYHEARNRPPADRAAFLADACRDDEALRHEVESLLDQASTNGFLARPALLDVPQPPGLQRSSMIGRTIGGYLIQALLGVGGMGEVYRARDAKLGRDVAIKILPPVLATDPDRLARFEREARTLATLNHPHICAIYGLETSDGIRFLILEHVDGDTLAERLQSGTRTGLAVPEVLAIARQIIDALEAAHEQGIVHRDLKPANIKVREDGTVKVLDFGLAKMLEPVRAEGSGQKAVGAGLTASPTITTPAMTAAGMILGTASYMAPEQARGKTVDKRADVWAFGVVLYEMLTGKRLFGGEEISDVLAAVLKTDPDWTALPANTPSGLRQLLRWCLEKDPKQRLRDIGDARPLLEDTAVPLAGGARSARWAAGWVAASVCLLAAAALAFVHFREAPPAPELSVRFDVPSPDKATISSFALSPDGRYLALVANEGGRTRLWIRPLVSLSAQALPGTDGAQGTPFWSPDGAAIGFFAEGRLKRVSVMGGPPQTVSEGAPGGSTGAGTWNRDGVVVFGGRVGSPLQRVSAGSAGVAPVALGSTPAAGERYSFPHFLPDGGRFLYTSTGGKPEVTGIYVGSLDGAPPVRILPDPSPAIYAPPASPGANGYLLFRREDTLMARPFDLDSLGKVAELVSLASPVRNFAASENGVLAHQAATTGMQQLGWVDRAGKPLESVGPASVYGAFRLAPDDKAIVFDRPDSATSVPDIWKLDLLRGVPTRLTTDPNVDNVPIWSFDGLHVVFGSVRNGGGKFDLYLKAATGVGQERLLVKMGTLVNGYATDWSRNGDILYQNPGANTGTDLWIAPQSGAGEPYAFLQERYNEKDGVFSPNGSLIAYVSDESGHNEVYVQAFPLSGKKWPISTDGGSDPHWRSDGTELFYLAANRNLMAVPVKFGRAPADLTFEPAKSLFRVPGNLVGRSYGAAANGQRFLLSAPTDDATASSVTVVMNWATSLKKQ